MTQGVPEGGAAFEAMMQEIDAALVNDNVPIHARALKAVHVVSTRYKISIPMFKPGPGTPPELQRYAQLGENIHNWYETRYGDRLKIDFSPGRMVIEVEGDLYVLPFPRIWGEVRFFVSRKFSDAPKIGKRGPVICNALQLIEDLTPARAAALSEDALRSIIDDFGLGCRAFYTLDVNQDKDLIRIAQGDIKTAVNNLMDRGQRNGESKWASLQAAEKIMKAAIALEGATFKFSHDLAGLCQQLHGLGVKVNAKPLIGTIQCTPGIRYGQESCTRYEALAAHRASLQLVQELIDAGAKFQQGPG